jgi:DNA adenine methylase
LAIQQLRPLLKWAGGKRQLLPELRRFYPARFNRYIEPFFGSGAVFFDLHAAGRLRGRDVLLIDANADLIGCYQAVRDRTEEVARELDEHARAHAANGRAHYYDVRDRCFNPGRERLRGPDGRIDYTPGLAAMFIYLNRTGFNGLFRLNARGAFNVPVGRYDRPRISSRDQLRRVADALAAPGVRLSWGPFELARELAAADDFVYCDPPYAPLSPTANFTSYTALRFDGGDQLRLQGVVVDLARRGCHVVVSNSTANEIAELYDTNLEARDAGLRVHRVPARRSINSNPARRGRVFEFLITNRVAAELSSS